MERNVSENGSRLLLLVMLVSPPGGLIEVSVTCCIFPSEGCFIQSGEAGISPRWADVHQSVRIRPSVGLAVSTPTRAARQYRSLDDVGPLLSLLPYNPRSDASSGWMLHAQLGCMLPI